MSTGEAEVTRSAGDDVGRWKAAEGKAVRVTKQGNHSEARRGAKRRDSKVTGGIHAPYHPSLCPASV